MFKVTNNKNGNTYRCQSYEWRGDNIVMDESHIVAGKQEDFTVVDLNAPKPYQWYIDVGPFFDRFGAAKMAVLTSSNPIVRAIVQDVSIRKWVDLSRPDVAAGIDAIIALGVPGVDAELKNTILTSPVLCNENSAVRTQFYAGV